MIAGVQSVCPFLSVSCAPVQSAKHINLTNQVTAPLLPFVFPSCIVILLAAAMSIHTINRPSCVLWYLSSCTLAMPTWWYRLQYTIMLIEGLSSSTACIAIDDPVCLMYTNVHVLCHKHCMHSIIQYTRLYTLHPMHKWRNQLCVVQCGYCRLPYMQVWTQCEPLSFHILCSCSKC